jgi:hypothetical protein
MTVAPVWRLPGPGKSIFKGFEPSTAAGGDRSTGRWIPATGERSRPVPPGSIAMKFALTGNFIHEILGQWIFSFLSSSASLHRPG